MFHAAVCRRLWSTAVTVVVGGLLVGLLAALTVAATAAPARAHAVLQAVTPADGADLDTAPSQVSLRFDEPVDTPRSGVRVFDSSGGRVDVGNAGPTAAAGEVAVDLRDDLGTGTYVVTWRAVSGDGHPLRGAWLFTVGGVTADSSLLADLFRADADRTTAVAAVAVRWLTYVAALFAGGAALAGSRLLPHMADDRRQRLRGWIRRAAVSGLVLTVVGVGTQAARATGLGLSAMVDPSALGDVAASGDGLSAGVRVVGLVAVLVWAARGVGGSAAVAGSSTVAGSSAVAGDPAGTRSRPAFAVAAGVLTVVSFAFEGHTVTTEPRWLAFGAGAVHLLTVAAWGAGLVVLWLALRGTFAGRPVPGARLVAAFSGLAFWSIVAVAVAGGVLGWLEVRELRALTSTTYGWTLVTKLLVLVPVAAAAVWNHYRLVPLIVRTAAADGDVHGRPVPAGGSDDLAPPDLVPPDVAPDAPVADTGSSSSGPPAELRTAAGRLRRSVAIEVVAVVAALGVTAVLVGLQPAAEAAGVTGAYSTFVPLGEDTELNVTVDPNRVGANEIHLYILGADGRQTDVTEEVTLALSQPDRDIGPLQRGTTRLGPGHFVLTGPELSVPGTWEIAVEVPVSAFDVLTATVPVTVSGG